MFYLEILPLGKRCQDLIDVSEDGTEAEGAFLKRADSE